MQIKDQPGLKTFSTKIENRFIFVLKTLYDERISIVLEKYDIPTNHITFTF